MLSVWEVFSVASSELNDDIISSGKLGKPDNSRRGELDISKVAGVIDDVLCSSSKNLVHSTTLLSMVLMEERALFKDWFYKEF